jgi:hypothetical protein
MAGKVISQDFSAFLAGTVFGLLFAAILGWLLYATF